MDTTAIVIPVYRPTQQLLSLVSALQKSGFKSLIVVDDGNGKDHRVFFDSLSKRDVTVLHHEQNMGKGAAIKTALRYLVKQPHLTNAITCDADGQHRVEDIASVATYLETHPNDFVLGVRDFSLPDVPARNKFGNTLTRRIFKFLTRKDIVDTQTGLRGIPKAFFNACLAIKENRFEYEMKMLLLAAQSSMAIAQLPIKTIYHQTDAVSSFRPVQDSFKIYRVLLEKFFKFVVVALWSAAIDISLFSFFFYQPFSTFGNAIFASTLTARVLSGIFNYLMNRYVTFESDRSFAQSSAYYFLLFVANMLLSALLVSTIYTWFGSWIVPIKLAVDTLLFLGSFYFQKHFIFRKTVQ